MYLTKTRPLKELQKFREGGGCIWIIASALWSRVLRIRLVNELKCIRPDLDLDQELANFYFYEIPAADKMFSSGWKIS